MWWRCEAVWPARRRRGTCRFDAPASAAEFDAGTEVVVVGRVRRRFFRAAGATASRTEVVAEAVLRAGQVKLVGTMLGEAIARVSDGCSTSPGVATAPR